MALPPVPTKTNSDSGLDDPKQALLTDLPGVIDWANALQAVLGNLVELNVGDGLEDDGAGSLRAKLQATSFLLREAAGLKLDTARATGNALLGTRWRDLPRIQKTANYTIQVTDAGFMIVFNSPTAVSAFLPALATADVEGMVVGIKNVGAGDVTIDPNGAETIGGNPTQVLKQDGNLVLHADLTALDWDIIGGGGAAAGFPSTTRMLFQQTSAPVGWTKQTDAAQNNAGLRIVTGTVTTGGVDTFSTVFGTGKSTQSRTLTASQVPVNAYDIPRVTGSGGAPDGLVLTTGDVAPLADFPTENAGGGGSHTHPLTNNLKFNDAIVGQKD